MNPESFRWGVQINASVYRKDRTPLDQDEVCTAFIDFAESKGWLMGGVFANLEGEDDDTED